MSNIFIMVLLLLVKGVSLEQKNDTEINSNVTTSSSISSSTELQSTTTTTTSTTETPVSSTESPNLKREVDAEEPIYCSCDLHPSFCDVNCCCDAKCTPADKRLFVRCSERLIRKKSDKSCYSDHIIYSVSPFNHLVSSASNLFCVEWSNVKKEDFFENRKPFSSSQELKQIAARHAYGWSSEETVTANSRTVKPYLRFADVLMFVKEGQHVVREWTLPHSFISGAGLCDSERSIRFLESISTSCLRYIHSLEENCNTFLSQSEYEGRIVIRRFLQGTAGYNSELQSVTRSETTTVGTQSEKSLLTVFSDTRDQVHECPPDRTCLPLRDNSNPSITSNFLSSPHPSCFNAVRKVCHEIFYDSETGVVKIETQFTRINLTGSRGYLRQFFEVKFTPSDSKSKDDEEVWSGNPGYAFHSALVAALIPESRLTNESIWAKTHSQRLQLPVLTATDGTCLLGKDLKMRDVFFGVNFRSSCFVNMKTVTQGEGSSNVCQKLQTYLMSLLDTRSNVTHTGIFGNSNTSIVSDWIPIRSENELPQVQDPAETAPLTASQKCPYLVTGLSYEIHYAFTGLLDEPQAKILSVFRKYKGRTSVQIDSLSSSPGSAVEAFTSVSFFDMTHSRRSVYAPAPVLKLQLPADFFYPFFISSSSCTQPLMLTFIPTLVILIFMFP